MGCSDEAAKLTSLCNDNLLNTTYKKNYYLTNKVTLPRNCNYNCVIELNTAHQLNLKPNSGKIFYKNCRKQILYSTTIELNGNSDYGRFCNSYFQHAQKRTVYVKFLDDEIVCIDKIATEIVATATTIATTLTEIIDSDIVSSCKKIDQNTRIDKILCGQCYPWQCHHRIGYCIQQHHQQQGKKQKRKQQRRIIHTTPTSNSNNKRSFKYTKKNNNYNTRICYYCHYPRKLQQLLSLYKHHHYHHHQHQHQHKHHKNSYNNPNNNYYESHVQPAQFKTLQHHHYQRKLHKEKNSKGNENSEEIDRAAKHFKSFATSSTTVLVYIAGFGKNNNNTKNNNSNKYNCLQQSLSHAYNNFYGNTGKLNDNIADSVHWCTIEDTNVTQRKHKLHYYSYHLQNMLQKQRPQYDFNSSRSVDLDNYCFSQDIRAKHNGRNFHHIISKCFENNQNSNKSTSNNVRTNATTTKTTAATATCTIFSHLGSSSKATSNPATVIHRPTICNSTFFTSVLKYIGRHSFYHTLRNSLNLYSTYTVLLVLFYLTMVASTAGATVTKSEEYSSIDKHPVMLIDWSKFDESSSDKEILDLLLEKKRYDKRLLPPVNDEDFCCGMSSPEMVIKENARRPHHRGTLTVNVNVLLLSLASPDESSLKYEVEFLLNQQWNDPRLEYGNKSHYDFLNALHHHESIWTPDTYFIMHGDFKDPIIPMHFALRIYRNGTITYAMRRHLILSCQGSLHIFPFDDPKCSFSMESISYEESQIKYVWKNDEDTLRKSPSLTTLNAYLIRNKTTPCDQNSWRGNYSCLRVDLIFTRDRAFYFTTVFIPGIILVTSSFITFWLEWNAVPARSMIGNYSCLQVELTFTRDRAYYFTTVFIPGIILVTSSFITFWLEWNAVPARVMIGVTTMLNFFTTSNGFRSTLPVVSNLTAMNVWDGVCMCFIYASLLEFVCVNYMGRKRPQHNAVYRPGENPVTQRLPAVLSRIGVILASPLVVIEREFHAALHSQRETTRLAALNDVAVGNSPTTPIGSHIEHKSPHKMYHQEATGDKLSSAVQHLSDRTYKISTLTGTSTTNHSRERQSRKDLAYEHTYFEPQVNVVTFDREIEAAEQIVSPSTSEQARQLKRLHSMSTNTPPLIYKGDLKKSDIEMTERQTIMAPLKPPRKKPSRSTSPFINYETLQGINSISVNGQTSLHTTHQTGEKKRETGGPNEIVACTTCGGSSSSPCTHSANNGCPTETCFVQVRKKEPPHPIRIAKTIDVIARITFPTAYAIFLIFFFVHYKGFS